MKPGMQNGGGRCLSMSSIAGSNPGPSAELLRNVMERIGEARAMTDPRPTVTFIAEEDEGLFAAE